MSLLPSDLKVVDADTHFSEPHDLWSSRVPAAMRDAFPHVVEHDGRRAWLFDGDAVMSAPAGSGSSVRRDGTKKSFWQYNIEATMSVEEASEAAYDPQARLRDDGSRVDLGADHLSERGRVRGQQVGEVGEPRSRQRRSSPSTTTRSPRCRPARAGRLFPQALVPFWDIEASVSEVTRAKTELGLTGITMCSEPHAGGLPDLIDVHWDPLWDVCSELGLPINFHVGASEFGMEAFFKSVWPSHDKIRRHVVGAVNIEMHNARIMTNLLASDLLDRFPKTKWVSVESGIGWIPYVIERLQYQLTEPSPDGVEMQITPPLELFRRQVYACFWFEEMGPSRTLDFLGFDNIMFETDFPHPTCLYPSAVEHGLKVLEPWGPEVQRKVMQDNAARLYDLPIP